MIVDHYKKLNHQIFKQYQKVEVFSVNATRNMHQEVKQNDSLATKIKSQQRKGGSLFPPSFLLKE